MPDQEVLQIDLRDCDLAQAVAVLNALLQARHALERKGLQVTIRKSRPSSEQVSIEKKPLYN